MALDSTVNAVVTVSFGVLVGALCGLFGSLSGLSDIQEQLPDEGFWDAFARRQREEQELLENPPKSARLVMWSLVALIAMFALVLNLSPLEIRWWAFVGGFCGGGAIMTGLVKVSQNKDLRLPGEKWLYRLFDSQRPKG